MREPRIFPPAEWVDVEVLVDGQWFAGELRAWYPVGEDGWEAMVQWRRGVGAGTRLQRLPGDQVRRVGEISRSSR